MNKFTNFIINKITSYIINPVKGFTESLQKRLDFNFKKDKNILHYEFYKQVKDQDYNKSYTKINEGKFYTYRYDYVEYLDNPKILTPELIENKTFLIRAYVDKEGVKTKVTISKRATKISQYTYFIYYVFSELVEYAERHAQSEIDVLYIYIEISVWQ